MVVAIFDDGESGQVFVEIELRLVIAYLLGKGLWSEDAFRAFWLPPIYSSLD